MDRMNKGKQKEKSSSMDSVVPQMKFKDIMKDIELFSSSHMSWKERKAMENRKVVSLGGKPVKKERLPLSVAKVMMKKQKERDEKMAVQNSILGRFGGAAKKPVDKRKPQNRALIASEGRFRNGVLDVQHLLHSSGSGSSRGPGPIPSFGDDGGSRGMNKEGKKGGGKKKNGKKKSRGGGGKRRH